MFFSGHIKALFSDGPSLPLSNFTRALCSKGFSGLGLIMLKKLTAAVVLGAVLLLSAALWLVWQDYVSRQQGVADVRPADVAVVLSTKVYEQGRLNPCLAVRVEAAAELYKAGRVKKLVMSGGINRDHRYGSRTMQMLAEQMGVPAEAIVQEDRSANTFENIVFSRPLIEGDKSVVIVSAGFHLPRARLLAQKQWTQDIQTYAAPFCSEPYGGYAYSIARELAAIAKNGLKGRY